MDTTTLLLRHMQWANGRVLGALAELPSDALAAYATDETWTVGRIAHHFTIAAGRYRGSLWPDDVLTEVPAPQTGADVRELAALCHATDERLLAAASLDDAPIERTLADGRVLRSTRLRILAQAVHHATEHRAQLVSALEARGIKTIVLDDLDLWHFDPAASPSGA